MSQKIQSTETALENVSDGARIMIGGFGSPGTPFTLIEALLNKNLQGLTIIKNDANEQDIGIDKLLASGGVRKLISSHIGLNRRAIEMMNDGQLEVEFVPQGILAERIRCAGTGLLGFVTDVGMDITPLKENEQLIKIDGRDCRFERAIEADFALIHASVADKYGNLRYQSTAMNFNPLMAMAGECTIVECAELSQTPIAPSDVHTPGIFVDALCELPCLSEVYQPLKHHLSL